jgi:hypothetical protein
VPVLVLGFLGVGGGVVIFVSAGFCSSSDFFAFLLIFDFFGDGLDSDEVFLFLPLLDGADLALGAGLSTCSIEAGTESAAVSVLKYDPIKPMFQMRKLKSTTYLYHHGY